MDPAEDQKRAVNTESDATPAKVHQVTGKILSNGVELTSATIRGIELPLLDPKTLNFETGLKVVNRTTRFVIPIPRLENGGELLVYPEGTNHAGEPIKKCEDGSPDRGIVFFNGTDKAWQAARGNGKEVILVNDVSKDQALALMTKLVSLGGPDTISLESVKALIAFARNDLGIVDFYDKKMVGVLSDMEILDKGLPLHMIVTKPTVHSALYVREPFTFNGPVIQVYPSGAVLLNDGKHTWGIEAGVFQRNFRAMTEQGERVLKSLNEEFESHD